MAMTIRSDSNLINNSTFVFSYEHRQDILKLILLSLLSLLSPTC
jgi:hypothetical protein